MLRRFIKRLLLRRKGILLDSESDINYSVANPCAGKPVRIVKSHVELTEVNEGVFLEHVTGYGDISLGRYTSISGPGTILHAAKGRIRIGAFSSIAQNVSIQQFNHDYNRPTSFAINLNCLNGSFDDDICSKGDILIEEDVWIASNVTILSGVVVGRGSVVGAGAVVAKSIPRYSIAFGNPAKCYKKRFSEEIVALLEESQWWSWDCERIRRNARFFRMDLGKASLSEIRSVLKG